MSENALPKRLVKTYEDDEYVLTESGEYIAEADIYAKFGVKWLLSYERLIEQGYHPPYPDILVRNSDGQRFAKNTYWTYCTEESYEEKGPQNCYTYEELTAMGCSEPAEVASEESEKVNPEPLPYFYLKIFNGCSAGAFGIRVFLGRENPVRLFEEFTHTEYDTRKDLFKRFVELENDGKLTFNWEVNSDPAHIDDWIAGRQDCETYIRELDSLRTNKSKESK